MTTLDKYDPQAIQDRWNQVWDQKGYFHSTPKPGKPAFSVVIPPPNVTGALHLGHALNSTLQDIIVRWKRMQGFEALWMPGTDHAGIATQAVVEKRLFEEEGKTRRDIGRDALVERIWSWKEHHEQRIISQLKAMGASCDWQRVRFTLDDLCSEAVRETFFRMFRDGLIYRGQRLVNWDAHLQTAVADDEIYHEDVDGHLWQFHYPIEGSDERVTVATTRPETMLGDTAVAIHPDDPRYKHLHGKMVRLPLVDRLIPIVCDGILVDPAFGTGVVKVTPAHDPNDYQTGLRHHLDMINIMTPDGRINANGGKYQGLSMPDARKAVLADLEALGLLGEIKPHQHAVGHSDRSKTVIEPYLSRQWFIRMENLAELAIQAVRDGRVKIIPERYADTYLRWLGEKRDWCISRQLWWGHRIPVWSSQVGSEKERDALLAAVRALAVDADTLSWAFEEDDEYRNTAEKLGADQARALGLKFGSVHVCLRRDDAKIVSALEEAGLRRDDDVLDTWFSSALWPFSTFGWPGDTALTDYYYPTSLLSTAREIITLWVARMVLMGEYNLGKVPFHDVFIHPVIQDGEGKKMSKTIGNGVDPFDIIRHWGADALRYTLCSMTTETQDVRMPVQNMCPHCNALVTLKPNQMYMKVKKLPCPECKKPFRPSGGWPHPDPELPTAIAVSEKFELGRNFGTKIYNAARFVLMNLADGELAGSAPGFYTAPIDRTNLATEDRWILARLHRVISTVTESLEQYRFAEMGKTMYEFVWNEFCDWYIEILKPRFRDAAARPQAQRLAALVLDHICRLLHPIMPFLTEEIWSALAAVAPTRGWELPTAPAEACCVAPWPTAPAEWDNPTICEQMDLLQAVIRGIRNIRAEFNLTPKTEVAAVIDAEPALAAFLASNSDPIRLLAKVGDLTIAPGAARPAKAAALVLPNCRVYLPLADHIDVAAEVGKQRKKLDDLRKRLAGVDAKLSNEKFVASAPAEVVDQQRATRADLLSQITGVEAIVAELGASE